VTAAKDTTEKTWGRRLAAARKAAKLTQAGAAELLGVSQPRWAELEGERFDPRLSTLKAAAAIVGVDVVALLADKPKAKKRRRKAKAKANKPTTGRAAAAKVRNRPGPRRK